MSTVLVMMTETPDFCFRCGRCCHNQVLITKDERRVIEDLLDKAIKVKPTERMCEGKYEIWYYWLVEDGCPCLIKDNGGYKCKIYENRPTMCRLFHCGRMKESDSHIDDPKAIGDVINNNQIYKEYKEIREEDAVKWGNAHGWHWRKKE